jgi:hypothetical protein
MVVPNSTLAAGDKISFKMTINGGCGQHPHWSVGGYWTSVGHGTSGDFNASTWVPTLHSFFNLLRVTPHTYEVTLNACAGVSGTYSVLTYPPGKHEFTFNAQHKWRHLFEALKRIPVPSEDGKWKWLEGQIKYEGGWKEHTDWRAFYEMKISGGFDPLIAIGYYGPIHPLTLVPGWLADYNIKAGFYIDVQVKGSFSLNWVGKYWPDIDDYDWSQIGFEGGVQGSVEPSINLKLGNTEIIDVEVAGKTGITGEFTGSRGGGDPSLEFVLKWDGIKAEATLKAGWGIIEWKREFQVLGEEELYRKDFLEDRDV